MLSCNRLGNIDYPSCIYTHVNSMKKNTRNYFLQFSLGCFYMVSVGFEFENFLENFWRIFRQSRAVGGGSF